jgi:hypothetical protein
MPPSQPSAQAAKAGTADSTSQATTEREIIRKRFIASYLSAMDEIGVS